MAPISIAFFTSPNHPIPRYKTSNIRNTRISSLYITPDRRIVNTQSIIYPPLRKEGEANKTESFRISKLEEIRGKLRAVGEASSVESLLMIDAIQRLGVDHHFRNEIEELLGKQYLIFRKSGSLGKDLHDVALRFRLLRQQGYYVSAGIFDEFNDQEGRFNHKISSDIRGLTELYEASHLSIEGEDILDDAAEFSAQHLKEWSKHHNHSHSSRIVQNTLNHPYHKSIAKLMAKKLFHKDSQGSTNIWIHILQEQAKTVFSMTEPLYQQEIHQISTWWKDLGLAEELQLARNQLLKWYIWSMSCLTDPTLSEQRIELTKRISLIYIIDDIFDVYGRIEELTLFTDVVNRWDCDDIGQLPDYMKTCFKALNDINNEISLKVYENHSWNPVKSLRKTWANLCDAFLVEAKWFASADQPSPEEYLKNGMISSGTHVVLVHIFFLLGEGLTKETVEKIDNYPGIISSVATILRLWDDLGNAKNEDQDGKDGSYIDCYMKEHQDITVQEARNHVNQIISRAWKQLNQECLSPNPFSSHFKDASLNLARMVPFHFTR